MTFLTSNNKKRKYFITTWNEKTVAIKKFGAAREFGGEAKKWGGDEPQFTLLRDVAIENGKGTKEKQGGLKLDIFKKKNNKPCEYIMFHL